MKLIKIWGDIISIKDLNYSLFITISSTFLLYFISCKINLNKSTNLAFGILGAIIGFIISNIFLKPKREFTE